MKKYLKNIFINYLVFCALIVTLELSLQLIYLATKGHFLFTETSTHKEIFEIHPYLAGRLKKSTTVSKNGITLTSTYKHTRYTGADLNNDGLIRIGVFGGSTTFGTGVTDKDSWPALLQTQLGEKYAVINYGVPGYSTVENIIQMALIAPEDNLDVVIIYSGWNDIKNYHDTSFTSDYYNHGIGQFSNLDIKKNQNNLDALQNIFVTFKLISKIKSRNTPTRQTFSHADTKVDSIYKRNLNTLKFLSKRMNAHSIFIPQILNDTYYLNSKDSSSNWTKHINNKAMPMRMSHFNNLMNNLCDLESNCNVLNDVLSIQWKEKHFVDDGHFSKEGGIIFSNTIAKAILKLN